MCSLNISSLTPIMSKSISLPYLQNVPIKILKSTDSFKGYKSLDNSPNLGNSKKLKNKRASFDLKTSRETQKRSSYDISPSPIGLPAKLDFVNTYRNRLKITEKTSFEGKEISPSVAYLEIIDKNRLKPMSFGLNRHTGKESDINIQGLSMGDNYAQAFSEGLKRCKSLEKINLKSNRLSEKGLTSIIGKLEIENIKYLCLSDNIISLKVVKQISEILIDSKCILKHLILESTKLNDVSATLIFESLALNNSVTHVNLARNTITDACGKILKSMLCLNSSLKKIDLHWNQLTASGCGQIFDGLVKNRALKELDLSWNLMSRDIEGNGIKTISEVLKSQTYLLHIDLSSNYLSSEQCDMLSQGLSSNHSILGLHMLGNDCHIDSRGFIKSDSYVNKLEQGHIRSRIFSEKKPKAISFNCCWLCEQWVETKFTWTGEISEPVCIHLECDDFQPDLMQPDPLSDSNHYTITRVVPPGKIRFFFSINLVIVKSKDVKVVRLQTPIEKEIEFWNSTKVKLFITNLNQIDVKGLAYNTKDSFSVLPRVPKQQFKPDNNQLEKIDWKFSTSIFKNYQVDDDLLVEECFMFDWRHTRIPNFTNESLDLDYTQKYLKNNYKLVKDTFKVLSCYSNNEVPTVGANVLADLLNQCKVFDDLYEVTDLGVNWNAVLVQSVKGQVFNPGNGLVRYEFLEIIVRIAKDKYVRKKVCFSLAEAVERLFKEHLLGKFENLTYVLDPWRSREYHVEIVDVVLKSHKVILDHLFSKYSGRKTLPGQKKFMCLDEFRDVCNEARLVNERLTTRDVDSCFYLAMMTQVDEIYKKRHVEMRFCEFIEGLARAAGLACVRKNGEEVALGERVMTFQEKLENAFTLLIKICSDSIQDTFVFPTEKTYEKLMYRPKGVIYRSTTLNLLDVSY